jgi:hypothetical protein
MLKTLQSRGQAVGKQRTTLVQTERFYSNAQNPALGVDENRFLCSVLSLPSRVFTPSIFVRFLSVKALLIPTIHSTYNKDYLRINNLFTIQGGKPL